MNPANPRRYQHFTVAVYCPVYAVQQMADPTWLQHSFDVMSRSIKIGKIYLETHRDQVVADEAVITAAKRFFEERGIQTAGGITTTANERNRFQTFCYTNPAHRQKLKEIVEYTARLFDEIILDDFFFTNCKCEGCIQAKGAKSWTAFRLELMEAAAKELVIAPARAVKPGVKLVIKYPNWYEHFQGLGFHLEAEPKLFDGIYTGTETRDSSHSAQHLQEYHGYSIFRYFENIKPGGNGGGWVDPFGMTSSDRYAEQLWLTLIAKAPEITLFEFRALSRPLTLADRAAWQGSGTSFDFDTAAAPARLPDGSLVADATITLLAGDTFAQADRVLGLLGKPTGVKAYKPYHSLGEDHLHSVLGMLGIPIDLVPEFPVDAPVVLLTQSAVFDAGIVEKIKQRLHAGKPVVITTGLLAALQGKGIEDIVELRLTGGRVAVSEYLAGWFNVHPGEREIQLPQIQYLTNDSWEEVAGISGVGGCPLFHSAGYAASTLYVLAVPDNYADFYAIPAGALAPIRRALAQGLDAWLDAPSRVSLFLYDNRTLIVESFRDEAVEVSIVTADGVKGMSDPLSGSSLAGEPMLGWRGQPTGSLAWKVRLPAHSYRVLRWDK
jgi:hypothetical protein